jgi:phosphoribosylglycinamide formyltransferase 1
VTSSSGPAPAGRTGGRPRTGVSTPTGEPVAASSARRVVVLVSGAGSNLAALLAAHSDPAYGARVVGVVSDNPSAGGLDMARGAGVPTAVVAPADFPDRPAWDRALAQAVEVFGAELVVSAGFMRILGPAFLERFPGRVVNTHPALLPSFPGAHGVRDALVYGVAVTGCTLHVVDAGVDTGPIIAQAAVPVEPGDDEASLHERIKVVERALLVDWVGRIARGSLQVDGRRVTVV